MTTLYNDTDTKAASWLRELVSGGHITKGPVNERSIAELGADDLRNFTRVHLFAGIGGWDYALRLAGWPDDRPVWTGSCPCQPFSAAGKGKGDKDERHLWPEMFRLIRECRPDTVFGEQVASAIGHGWLDGVFADLEGEGYACGAVVLGAHSVGAPHIRQRLYWAADAECGSAERSGFDLGAATGGVQGEARERQRVRHDAGDGGDSDGLGLAACGGDGPVQERGSDRSGQGEGRERGTGGSGASCGLGDTKLHATEPGRAPDQPREGNGAAGRRAPVELGRPSHAGGLGDTDGSGLQVYGGRGCLQLQEPPGVRGQNGHWSAYDLIPCRDGKSRRVESGTFPLAHGVPARVGRLRGYGNAIVPQVAAEFVMAFLESNL